MNYIGSKLSLLDFLQETIQEVTGFCDGEDYVFADLFAGTGIVGATFRRKGCRVISNDIQYYSYVLNKHLIENTKTVDAGYFTVLNALEGRDDGFVYNTYCAGSGSGRNYFSDSNGRRCDAIRMKIEELYQSGEIDEKTYFYYLASFINSVDKYANTASVYGAFLKQLKKSAQKDLVVEPIPIIPGQYEGCVYNQDVNQLIPALEGDVLYLDPPYNARQYCTNYHMLETLARYDNPQVYGKTGLRDYAAQKSGFCSKRMVLKEFDRLLAAARFKYIFLSYNNEGIMSLDDIREIMGQYGQYSVFTKEYKRFRADKEENRHHKASETIEYLHCICR